MSNKKYSITLNGVAHEVVIAPQGSDDYIVTVDGELFNVAATTLSLEDISNHILSLSENSFVYTGEEIRPNVLTDGTVTEGIDYNIIYSILITNIIYINNVRMSKTCSRLSFCTEFRYKCLIFTELFL